MKRIIILFLSIAITLTGCSSPISEDNTSQKIADTVTKTADDISDIDIDVDQFSSLDNADLLTYVEDNIYSKLDSQLDDRYMIENVAAQYISQEYLDEAAFNSQENIYFGYTLSNLNSCFQGTKYIFTLDKSGKTNVKKMQEIEDDTTQKIIKNVAIGTGVILICVTIAYFASKSAIPDAVNLIFAGAAKTGSSFALSSTVFGGISSGVVRGIETGDMSEALKAAADGASEGFKWGAITGSIAGGSSAALQIYRSSKTIPTFRESELKVFRMRKSSGKHVSDQVAFLNRKEVTKTTSGSTRPDVVEYNTDGTINAIEVKNYNLESMASRSELLHELNRQITSRVANLPKGSTQEIVLDIRGRHYPQKLINGVKQSIKSKLNDVYQDIPVTILRY